VLAYLTKPGRLHVVCEGELYRVYAHDGAVREIERIADGATARLETGDDLARWEAGWASQTTPTPWIPRATPMRIFLSAWNDHGVYRSRKGPADGEKRGFLLGTGFRLFGGVGTGATRHPENLAEAEAARK
jgi:hypothetical protein